MPRRDLEAQYSVEQLRQRANLARQQYLRARRRPGRDAALLGSQIGIAAAGTLAMGYAHRRAATRQAQAAQDEKRAKKRKNPKRSVTDAIARSSNGSSKRKMVKTKRKFSSTKRGSYGKTRRVTRQSRTKKPKKSIYKRVKALEADQRKEDRQEISYNNHDDLQSLYNDSLNGRKSYRVFYMQTRTRVESSISAIKVVNPDATSGAPTIQTIDLRDMPQSSLHLRTIMKLRIRNNSLLPAVLRLMLYTAKTDGDVSWISAYGSGLIDKGSGHSTEEIAATDLRFTPKDSKYLSEFWTKKQSSGIVVLDPGSTYNVTFSTPYWKVDPKFLEEHLSLNQKKMTYALVLEQQGGVAYDTTTNTDVSIGASRVGVVYHTRTMIKVVNGTPGKLITAGSGDEAQGNLPQPTTFVGTVASSGFELET